MKKGLRIAIAVVLGMVAAGWIYRDKAPNTEQQLDTALSSMPVWQVIKEQEPEFRKKVQEEMLALQKAGKNEQQIIDTVQPKILHLQMARLQNAPDANVVEYMKINMEQTAAMQKVSDDSCYRFLYPEVKGGVNPMRLLDKDLMQRRMQADVDMMRAAAGPDKHTVTPQEIQQAETDVVPIIQKLTGKYGDDIELLQMPQKGKGKEKQSCDLVQDLWNNVLALPEPNAAGLIRYAVSDL
ncbi:topoisomerase II [Leclercia adecarboxylata]|uniref:Topoisomerase II n=1 Tax=Leclercia adecarboxylata TaxID=83655 RepID=A0A9X3Y640_9ENTR|nr:topoisomerase II [Leclercia adecarboxylata]MBD1405831.1 topoisomerase II [Leclercia adecarboxylata]MDC6624249.1 topoisomerase II [Leclercia adecarboxylata]MDC6635463.1 topoisomerase II [Leclercia adecarboxylata]MDC6637047.1 topoisomerase II [Leclercia adecarboxylata]MDC6648535.1 topoisomerase II [Leclercia adecarboxylata]